nr:response regulator [Prolixibacteraceae bacterium]
EDHQDFLWFETYDGYFHHFNPAKESFSTLPNYLVSAEEKYSKMNCFFQYSATEIWLGSTNSGVYRLTYDSIQNNYIHDQFLSRGQFSISNNNIRFIIADRDSNIYIGAKNGLNILNEEDNKTRSFYYQHYFSDLSFTCAVAVNNEVWLGTENNGLVVYNLDTKSFYVFNTENSALTSNRIDALKLSSRGNVLIGSCDFFIYQPIEKRWLTIKADGKRVDKIVEDFTGLLWVTTGKFGVQQVNQQNGNSKHFDLTPANHKYLSDKQRPYFYEDSNNVLWICVHGAGLAQYNRQKDEFYFFRNNPLDLKSISSNTVMCMTEDKNGTLWVGAGLQGGINKVIFKNPAFNSIAFKNHFVDYMENIVRSLIEDSNKNTWVASKGGKIKIYNQQFEEVKPSLKFPFEPQGGLVFNVYSMFQDSKGYVWLGSKGAGVAVSKFPVNSSVKDYSKVEFFRYLNDAIDSTSLCNNNIYCIDEDVIGRIWIGTYGGGFSVSNPKDVSKLKFVTISSNNSNLSNNMVRDVAFDSDFNLWAATTFGLNKLSAKNITENIFNFDCYYNNPENKNSLSYNDVVHIFEDVDQNMWFGTFGGGLNLLTSENTFIKYTHTNGLSNNEVFGIIQDQEGYIWLSTGNGLSRLDPRSESFENFNKSNSLSTNSFSENTCLNTSSGKLVFGSVKGIEIVDPKQITSKKFSSKILFTKFQLFNKEIDVNSVSTPLVKSIINTECINLQHNQSSFSVEFSAMNFLDASKTQYAYILENFDDNWNYIGLERKATYTNLKPGEYTFKVKAALWNGNWENEVKTMNVTINPPWWQTNIAYIFYLIVFVLLTFIVSRGVIRVNSFRNELKVEKAVNEVKLQFFTNISHEIRTPLTLILGPIEDVLADHKFPLEFRPTLGLVQKNGKRMLHLLNQLLDFRKVQNKKMTLKVAPVDLVDFTKSIFDNFIPQAKHKGINFNFISLAHPENVWADPHRIDSVIFNVLSNAFKFTPKGKRVSVSIDQNLKLNEVYIKIVDGGPGIKSKDIPLIFNRYSILSDDSESTNGTGIGLNLSNEFVKMHGGEIRVESQQGKGCLFNIVLKTGTEHFAGDPNVVLIDKRGGEFITKSQLTELLPTEKENQDDDNYNVKIGEKRTILVVEDNFQILNYVAEALSTNYSILTAKNGKDGIDATINFNPDLIVSDIMMPEIDGIEMTKILKSNFDTCHIPIILLTAKSSINDQILGINSGAEAYILKPFNMSVLKSTINNMLEQRKLMLKKFRDKTSVEASDLKITSRNKEFLDKVVKYIEENYSDPDLSISSLVEYSCVSRTVFYNKIKSLTGHSPIELMRQIKMQIAAQMLTNGFNVNEAAFQIGFNDSRYFSKQFKELYGESPSQYKKKHIVDEALSV